MPDSANILVTEQSSLVYLKPMKPVNRIVLVGADTTKKFIIDFETDTLKCYGTMTIDDAAKIFFDSLIKVYAEWVRCLGK
ncbi:MAG: hypothetical protein ACTSXK_11300 [Promethearchaeota archaeon]